MGLAAKDAKIAKKITDAAKGEIICIIFSTFAPAAFKSKRTF